MHALMLICEMLAVAGLIMAITGIIHRSSITRKELVIMVAGGLVAMVVFLGGAWLCTTAI
jgi:hypothetical protein